MVSGGMFAAIQTRYFQCHLSHHFDIFILHLFLSKQGIGNALQQKEWEEYENDSMEKQKGIIQKRHEMVGNDL